ncbi:hypothetical protein UFOVP53_73 [uncultured Caudovirales phage]|uniref:Uncharacterized protein n=1 Tax=uncultured Caudovirales phage TaxID=2100421 RepID=A0A6J5KY67_9CAUD|nr:hypothetical protein UFOVP53_73 [uncultured Caudovirales phage]
MKTINLNLQASISNTYDKTKTTIAGRVVQKTINSQQVVGPTLTQFIDCQTQTANSPTLTKYNATTGRLFVLASISATPTILLFNVSLSGVQQYVGKIILTLANSAATTHTARGFDVDDTGATWQIIVATTGSVAINGGIFVAANIVAGDFVPAGTTIWAAQSSGQKGVYFLQDNLFKGINHNMTTLWGVVKMHRSSNSAFNTKIYTLNNTVVAPQIFSFDVAGTATVADTTASISAQTTLYAGTTPSAFFTSGTTNPGLSANDPVILTGIVPANFVSSAINALQTVYFVRDIQLITGSYYFNLAATSGGVAVTPTSNITSTITMMRAFGTNTSFFYGRTPAVGITPSLVGTLVQNNVVDHAQPTSVPLNANLNGQDCIALGTQTQLYLGKVADLFTAVQGTSTGSTITITGLPTLNIGMAVSGPGITPGSTVTSFGNNGVNSNVVLSSPVITPQVSSTQFVLGANSWTSLTGANIIGSGLDVVSPVITYVKYSDVLDRFIYITNTSTAVVKQLKNNEITGKFGNVDNTWLEAPSTLPTVPAGLATVSGLETQGGMIFLSGTTTGQRGVTFVDLYSDNFFGNSYAISPVTALTNNSILKYVNTIEQLFDYTNTINLHIRTGATSSDAIFNNAVSGWIPITKATDLNLSISNNYFQIMIDFNVMGSLNATPSQIQEIALSLTEPNEISDYWSGSVDNTTQNGISPSMTAFRLAKAYATVVPTLYFRAYDDSNNLVASANTASNPTLFEYSTNNGTSWNALGAISNTALTTEIRYKWATPPGVNVTCSLRES